MFDFYEVIFHANISIQLSRVETLKMKFLHHKIMMLTTDSFAPLMLLT